LSLAVACFVRFRFLLIVLLCVASRVQPTLEGARCRYIAASAPLPSTFNDW
jgi:hypothetical protein